MSMARPETMAQESGNPETLTKSIGELKHIGLSHIKTLDNTEVLVEITKKRREELNRLCKEASNKEDLEKIKNYNAALEALIQPAQEKAKNEREEYSTKCLGLIAELEKTGVPSRECALRRCRVTVVIEDDERLNSSYWIRNYARVLEETLKKTRETFGLPTLEQPETDIASGTEHKNSPAPMPRSSSAGNMTFTSTAEEGADKSELDKAIGKIETFQDQHPFLGGLDPIIKGTIHSTLQDSRLNKAEKIKRLEAYYDYLKNSKLSTQKDPIDDLETDPGTSSDEDEEVKQTPAEKRLSAFEKETLAKIRCLKTDLEKITQSEDYRYYFSRFTVGKPRAMSDFETKANEITGKLTDVWSRACAVMGISAERKRAAIIPGTLWTCPWDFHETDALFPGEIERIGAYVKALENFVDGEKTRLRNTLAESTDRRKQECLKIIKKLESIEGDKGPLSSGGKQTLDRLCEKVTTREDLKKIEAHKNNLGTLIKHAQETAERQREENKHQGNSIIAQLETGGMPKKECDLLRGVLKTQFDLDELRHSATSTNGYLKNTLIPLLQAPSKKPAIESVGESTCHHLDLMRAFNKDVETQVNQQIEKDSSRLIGDTYRLFVDYLMVSPAYTSDKYTVETANKLKELTAAEKNKKFLSDADKLSKELFLKIFRIKYDAILEKTVTPEERPRVALYVQQINIWLYDYERTETLRNAETEKTLNEKLEAISGLHYYFDLLSEFEYKNKHDALKNAGAALIEELFTIEHSEANKVQRKKVLQQICDDVLSKKTDLKAIEKHNSTLSSLIGPTKERTIKLRQEQNQKGLDIIAQLKTHGEPDESCKEKLEGLHARLALDEQSDCALQTDAFVKKLSDILKTKIEEQIEAANEKAKEVIQTSSADLQETANVQRIATMDSKPEDNEKDNIEFYQNKLQMLNDLIEFLKNPQAAPNKTKIKKNLEEAILEAKGMITMYHNLYLKNGYDPSKETRKMNETIQATLENTQLTDAEKIQALQGLCAQTTLSIEKLETAQKEREEKAALAKREQSTVKMLTETTQIRSLNAPLPSSSLSTLFGLKEKAKTNTRDIEISAEQRARDERKAVYAQGVKDAEEAARKAAEAASNKKLTGLFRR